MTFNEGKVLQYFSDATIYKSIGRIVINMNILVEYLSEIKAIFPDNFMPEMGQLCEMVAETPSDSVREGMV
jgi:hypothetical protein